MALVGHFCSPGDFLLLGFQKVLVRRYQLVNEFCCAQSITHIILMHNKLRGENEKNNYSRSGYKRWRDRNVTRIAFSL